MPDAGAEPYHEQAQILVADTKERKRQEIIPEEGTKGKMPSLPEFRDILTKEGMVEVLVKVESEDSAKTPMEGMLG